MNIIDPQLSGGLRAARRAVTRALVASLLLGALGALAAPAARAACLADPKPVIYVTRTTAGSGVATGVLELIDNVVSTDMARHAGTEVMTALSQVVLGDILAARRMQELLGAEEDRSGVLQEMAAASGGGDWTVTVNAAISGSNGLINIRMLDMRRGGAVIKAETINIPITSSGGWPTRSIQQGVATFAAGLGCQVRQARRSPVIPRLQLGVQPSRGQPGDSLAIALRLTDLAAAGAPEANKAIVLEITTPQGERSSRTLTTDDAGLVQTTLVLGATHARAGVIKARFVRADGYIRDAVPVNFYVVAPAGDLSVAADKAQLLPQGGDTVRAVVRQNGKPVANQAVALAASGGVVAAASVVTDSTGSASVGYVAPGAAALVAVNATATLPSSASVQASLSYVVDPAVVVSMQSGGDTTTLGSASLKVDVERDRRPVAGATVAFAVSGGGTVSAATASTDSVGRAEVLFITPPRPGASTLTATAVIDGQTYTRNVTVRYSDPLDALTREIADVKEAMWLNPSDTTLTRLNTLRGALLARGEASRAESLLADPLVQSPLSCVQERAHRECAAALRSKGEATLGLVKGITNGSARLDWLYSRAKDSLRVCPYPAFMTSTGEGSVFGYATFSDITLPPANWEFFIGISWDQNDRIRGFTFSARDETNRDNLAVSGFAPTGPGDGSLFTGRIEDGDLRGTWGNRFLMRDYQSRATAPTVAVTVNGMAVSANIALYEGEYEGVMKTARIVFTTTVALPPAPSLSCANRALPTGD